MTKFFKLKERKTDVSTEILAGTTTFVALAYVISLIPNVFLSAVGIDPLAGFSAFLVTAILSTLIGGLYANLPLAFASGIGLSAFFAFTVCAPLAKGGMGYSVQTAMTALLLEGIVFIVLSGLKVREKFMDAIPKNLKKGISVGIGLFIAVIGFVDAGITKASMKILPDVHFSLLAQDPGSVFGLNDVNNFFMAKLYDKGHITPAFWSIVGLVLIAVLLARKVKGAILIGIVIITIAGLLPASIGGGFTKLPSGSLFQIPQMPKLFQYDFSWTNSFDNILNILIVLFTLLFVDMFDTIGTLMGIGAQGKMLTKDGKFPQASRAFMADAVGTTVASALGTTAVTAYIESASGVAEGGKTGLTAVTVAVWMLIALFFAPLFLMVPLQATAPALMVIGFYMLGEIASIPFDDITEAVPAYLAVIVMPFTFSIVNGIALGMISYVVLKLATGKAKQLNGFLVGLSLVFLVKLLFLSA